MKRVVILIFIAFTLSVMAVSALNETGCSACNRTCPQGQACFKNNSGSSKCMELNPCSYYQCPENYECKIITNDLAIYCPDGSTTSSLSTVYCKCNGPGCLDESGMTEPVSYDVNTGIVTIGAHNAKISINTTSGSRPGYSGEISIETYNIPFNGNLAIKESSLIMETSSGDKKINVMPNEAIEIAKVDGSDNNIELIKEHELPVYSITSKRKARLFAIIPLEAKINAKVNAENKDLLYYKRPAWSFLATGV